MERWQRRAAAAVGGVTALVLLFAVAYSYGMTALEGESRTFGHSLQVVVETMATAGYGADSPWQSAAMNWLVVLIQLSGRLIGLLAATWAGVALYERLGGRSVAD